MHILIIPSWYPNSFNSLDGIFFKEQAEALAKLGHNVTVISINQYSVLKILKHKKIVFKNNSCIENDVHTYNVEYPTIPKLHFLRKKLGLLLFKKKFQSYVEKNGLPDIVHVHSFSDGDFALWIKKTYNIPYVVTEHFSGFARGAVSEANLEFAQSIFSNSHANIVVSNEFKKLLEDKFHVPFSYIPNIVNTNFFTPSKKRSSDLFRFINIAFLDKNKNQNMLIKAFGKAFKHANNTLTIVGDGPEYTALSSLIEELNLQKQVFLYGKANRNEVKKLLQQSDAFVLPSRYETFGVVVIEAMSCGLPVIATKCGGPESILINEKLGELVDIGIDSISEGMKKVYLNNYSQNYIRDYVIDNFSEDVVGKKIIQIYKKVIR